MVEVNGNVGRLAAKGGRVLSIESTADVASAAATMSDHQVGCLLVANTAGSIVGIVTERDIMTKVVAVAGDPRKVTVEEIMVQGLVWCGPDTSISKARRIMAQNQIRHLPIIANGTPVGMISSRDILAFELSSVRAIARQQSRLLRDLESQFPGITCMNRDGSGRIVIQPTSDE